MPNKVNFQDPVQLAALQRIAAESNAANAANGRVPVLQRPIKFSTPGDINSSVNPQMEAAIRGFTGTAPQDLGASVFNPQSQSINSAGEMGYLAGQALGAAPAVGPAAKFAGRGIAEAVHEAHMYGTGPLGGVMPKAAFAVEPSAASGVSKESRIAAMNLKSRISRESDSLYSRGIDYRDKLAVLARYTPKNMSFDDYLAELQSEPDLYKSVDRQLEQFAKEHRSTLSGLDRQGYIESLESASPSVKLREMALYDKHKGEFPSPAYFVDEDIDPKVFEIDHPSTDEKLPWLSDLDPNAAQALAGPLEGTPFRPAVKQLKQMKSDFDKGLNTDSMLKKIFASEGDFTLAPDAFWMNAQTKHVEPFGLQYRHSSVIQDPDYAAYLGVTPEQAMSYPIVDEAKPLMMGRRTKNTLSINGLDNPTDMHLEAAQQVAADSHPDVSKINFGGGDRLYENVPIDKFMNADSLTDLTPFQLYKKGGSVRNRVIVEDPVIIEKKLKLMGLI